MNDLATFVHVDDPAAWYRHDVVDDQSQWQWSWSERMLEDIRTATTRIKNLPLEAINRETFSLPTCMPLLTKVASTLDRGLGFAVIKGFRPETYEQADVIRAYLGVSSHLGNALAQTSKGDRIVDVLDKGKAVDGKHRGYLSKSTLPFHTDGAYLVGLLFLETSSVGGESLLTSAVSVYNELGGRFPASLEWLSRGFYYDRRGDHVPGENPVSNERIPTFSFHNKLLHCCYNRNNIEFAPANSGVLLSDAELAALDAFDSIARDPRLTLNMAMGKGDMQFLNNFVVLHSRTEYVDQPGRPPRHAIRLWMDNPEGRRHGPSLLDIYTASERRFKN